MADEKPIRPLNEIADEVVNRAIENLNAVRAASRFSWTRQEDATVESVYVDQNGQQIRDIHPPEMSRSEILEAVKQKALDKLNAARKTKKTNGQA